MDDQVAVGLAAAKKLAKKYRHSSFFEQQQKVKQGLMQKGFGGDSLSLIIEVLALEADEDSEADALAELGAKKMAPLSITRTTRTPDEDATSVVSERI